MAQTPLSPLRALILNLMLSAFVASAVFVVVAKLVLVPQLARQELEIRELRGEVAQLRADLEEAEDEAAAPGAQAAAPAPGGASAVAPAAGGAAPAAAAPVVAPAAATPVPTAK